MNDTDKSQLSRELLLAYHEQFAENARTREQSFLKIVGFLGAVIVGYAYVYENSPDDVMAFAFAAIASIILLTFGAAIIVVIAQSYRRDQYVNARIRRDAKIVAPDGPLPADYNPTEIHKGKINKLFWMPNIFFVYYLVFPLFQLMILFSFVTKREFQATAYDCATVGIGLASFLLTFLLFLMYRWKLRNKIRGWT